MPADASPRSSVSRLRSSDSGFTLIEILVAITVFAIVSGALGTLLLRTTRMSATNRGRVVAANLASQKIEFLRNSSKPTVAVTSETALVGGVTYTVTSDLRWVMKDETTNSCDGSTTTTNAYIRGDVKVTWPNMDTTKPVTSSTVILPPSSASTVAAGQGAVAVRILLNSGSPSAGHVVTLVSPKGAETTQSTDGYGCARFGPLAAGSYTASVATPGYADLSGNPRPSQGLTITASAKKPETWQLTYDKVGS